MIRVVAVLLLAVSLAGCETLTGSIAGGECKVFERPPYAVRGLRSYDQNWVDSQIEGGVGACGWKRPAPRPASIDAQPARNPAAAPAKKPGFVKRSLARVKTIWPKPSPVAVAPVTVPEPAPMVVPPLPAPKRSAIDELLNPTGEPR